MDYQDVQFVTPEDDPASTPVRHDGGLSAPPPPSPSPSHQVSQSRLDWDAAAQLNTPYTFDAVVIGSGKQFTQPAGQAGRQSPSNTSNPLLLVDCVVK